MTTMLFHAHSGLRYLVLLAALAAIAACAYALATDRPVRAARGLTAAYAGLLDLQILLGIALIVSGIFYGALMGHLVMMVLAAVAAHAASVLARRQAVARVGEKFRLVGLVASLVCIVGGIMAIGRSVFGSGAPTVG
jgi:hypothetical protein